MTIIERVARAIAQSMESNGAAPYDGFDAILGIKGGKRAREQLFEEARNAIKAMHEPTDKMIEAAFGKHESPHPFRTAWYAMIDAALKE